MAAGRAFLVGVVIGSDSDLGALAPCMETLEQLGIPAELEIISAHRTPGRASDYASSAEDRGVRVIVAAAGGAAHLAGVIAAWSVLPVIGVPVRTQGLGGLDSLLSMVQMPGGVPVATVAIDGAKNAALLAAEILGVSEPEIRERVREFKKSLAGDVERKAQRLKELGYRRYLEEETRATTAL